MQSNSFPTWLWPSISIGLLSVVIGLLVMSSRGSSASPPADIPAGSRVLSMRAPEMFCIACEAAVEGALSPVQGVLFTDATIDTKEVSIIYDPEQITSDQILSQSIFDAYGREFVSDELYTPTSL